tara:strand:- start:260 stop:478 length:219 start_codon:yes stop_codon:yes gene_type:complete
MNFDNYPELLNTGQLAEILGVAKHTIEARRCEGTFPIAHLSLMGKRTVRYAKSDVIAYLQRCQEEAQTRSCA